MRGPTDRVPDAAGAVIPVAGTPALVCALLLAVAGCSSSLSMSAHSDSGTGGTRDAGRPSDGKSDAGDTLTCSSLFQACRTDGDCCAPNRCLDITGTLQCQQEGPVGGRGGTAGSQGGGGAAGGGAPGGLHATFSQVLPSSSYVPFGVPVAVDANDTAIVVSPSSAGLSDDPGPKITWFPAQGRPRSTSYPNAVTPAAMAIDQAGTIWLVGQLYRAVSFGGSTAPQPGGERRPERRHELRRRPSRRRLGDRRIHGDDQPRNRHPHGSGSDAPVELRRPPSTLTGTGWLDRRRSRA